MHNAMHAYKFCVCVCVSVPVPPAAGLGSSSRPCSSPRSAWRTSWPACSSRPSLSAARRSTSSSPPSACCTLEEQKVSSITRCRVTTSASRFLHSSLLSFVALGRCSCVAFTARRSRVRLSPGSPAHACEANWELYIVRPYGCTLRWQLTCAV